MLSPYGLDIIESCLTCKMRADRIFCDLPTSALQSFESIKYATAYPKGAVLFVEGQAPRGIFVLCKGRVKLSICATDGKTLILKIAEPGEVLGLSASVSGKPYELTAETIDPCQVNFVKREEFLRFLKEHADACFKVAEQLSEKYNNACHEVRSLGLSHSAGEKLAKLHTAMVDQTKSEATIGWDSSPITVGRMCAEVYAQIRGDDWSLVGNTINNTWPLRLWNIDKAHRWNGVSGGAGIGYNAPASLGAALANKRHGRLTVTFNGDGDLMYVPSTLWTAAHHRIPLLYVVQNNRAYHQEYMYLQAMANRHGRGLDNVEVGTTIKDPNVDFAAVARGFGVYGEGPIEDPKELGPALTRAIAVVKRGEPALIDVITDQR